MSGVEKRIRQARLNRESLPEMKKVENSSKQQSTETPHHGSPEFYSLLEKAAEIHNAKSHDYASNSDPYGNYLFAGKLSKLFDNPDDAGFIGRIGEKLFRLANLENGGKKPKNESVEDTEIDICVITLLWMACRREKRKIEAHF